MTRLESSRTRMSTRSQSRAQQNTPQPPHTPSTPASTGMTYLTELLSDYVQRMQRNAPNNPRTPLQIQPTIDEERELEMSGSEISDDQSTAQPNNLLNHPTYQLSNHESNNQSDDESFHSCASQPNNATTISDAFGAEFGPMVDHLDLDQLEKDRATILQPMLELDYSKIEVSNITRHMWAHVKDMPFETKDEMYAWVRNHWKIEIIQKMQVVSALKTAGTRNCQLCMKERVQLFYAMHEKKTSHNLMNSRSELFGKCTCKTRFLRLYAVGNAGADEAS